jgi:G3E family GTPase
VKTKIDIISGFLGAGKTTLIKKLLAEKLSGEKLVIIENEFGEIGIDGSLLKRSGIEIKELNSGCICCNLAGDLEVSILEVVERFHPERVIIEPSGVGKMSEVIKACESPKLKEMLQINMLITVVDVFKYEIYLANFGEFFENQIRYAKTVVLSRTQKVTQEKLESVVSSIHMLNGKANIVTTPWESLKAEQIISVAEQDAAVSLENQLIATKKVILKHATDGETCKCGHGHTHDPLHHCDCGCGNQHKHSHNADEIFEVWSVETPGKFEEAALKLALRKLDESKTYGAILRGKGILQAEKEHWLQFDYVPGEAQVTGTSADYSGRLCIIGKNLNKPELNRLFHIQG